MTRSSFGVGAFALAGCAQILGVDVSPETLNPCLCDELTELPGFEVDTCNGLVNAAFEDPTTLLRAVDLKCDICGEATTCYSLIGASDGAPCEAVSDCGSLACCVGGTCCAECQACGPPGEVPYCVDAAEKLEPLLVCLSDFLSSCASACPNGSVFAYGDACFACLSTQSGEQCRPLADRCTG